MSAHSGDHHPQIIVVHRHGDHEDGHHGGAWKIAFADFMTAMMCFFLVMWLINAANEQTKASVASYFNPVKLVDRNPSRKGLDDAEEGPETGGAKVAGTGKDAGPQDGDAAGSAEASDTQAPSDASLFADPYAVLAEIAEETGASTNSSRKGEGGAQAAGPATGASGGESYRDPFAPDFWTRQVAVPSEADASAERSAPAPEGAQPGDSLPEEVKGSGDAKTPDEAKGLEEAKGAANPDPTLPAGSGPKPQAGKPAEEPEKAQEQDQKKEQEPKPSPATEKAAEAIRKELAESFDGADEAPKDVSVEATDKGVVIAVTEGLDFGMFEIGSAVPESALVHAMDKIGAAVKEQNGTITIQGHTDARPFHSDRYDNWRLSTARAHAAYYMLVRAGLDEKRIVEVAGLADRRPRNPADPLAAENRRIEILLQVDK